MGNEITVEVPVKHWWESKELWSEAVQFFVCLGLILLDAAEDGPLTYVAIVGAVKSAVLAFIRARKPDLITGIPALDRTDR